MNDADKIKSLQKSLSDDELQKIQKMKESIENGDILPISKKYDGICTAFVNKLSNKLGMENKVRYLLEDFFFKEGWANRTNPEAMKEGYNAQLTYNKGTIDHFVEDFTRLLIAEFDDMISKEMLKAKIEAIIENSPCPHYQAEGKPKCVQVLALKRGLGVEFEIKSDE